MENQGLTIITGGQRNAEDAGVTGRPSGRDVTHPPRCPQAIHSISGVDELAEPLADLEERDALLRDAHAVARLRVASLAGVPMPDPEAAEPAQLHLVALGEGVGDVVEDGVDDQLRLLLREGRHSGHFLDEIRFGHDRTPSQRPVLAGPGPTSGWRAWLRLPGEARM